MRLMIDDDLPPIIAARLRALGHDVSEVRNTPPDSDNRVYRSYGTAIREGRLFITTRQYFASYRSAEHSGILIVKLSRPNRENFQRVIFNALKQIPDWSNVTAEVRDDTLRLGRGPVIKLTDE